MTDDDLRARLRRADPARSLPPAAPGRVSRLLEETMTTTIAPAPPRRRYALLAAAALLLIAAGAGWLVTRPSARAPQPVPAPVAAVELTATGAQAKCAEPTPEVLAAEADFAFAGAVTGIEGGTVTLRVTRVYRGTAATEVRVAQTSGASEQLLGASRFETGRNYLVASTQGAVMICGYSGEADIPGLPELYDRAF